MPLVRTQTYDDYNLVEYPLGANAIVAVISYTVRAQVNHEEFQLNIQKGYDMEDAMIISKSSCERGFGKAVVISFKVHALVSPQIPASSFQ